MSLAALLCYSSEIKLKALCVFLSFGRLFRLVSKVAQVSVQHILLPAFHSPGLQQGIGCLRIPGPQEVKALVHAYSPIRLAMSAYIKSLNTTVLFDQPQDRHQ